MSINAPRLAWLPLGALFALTTPLAQASCGTGVGGPDGGEAIVRSPQYIVVFDEKKASPWGESTRAADLERTVSSIGINSRHVRRMSNGAEIIRLDTQSQVDAERARAQLAARPDVAYVIEDRVATAFSTVPPNDPEYPNQWALHGTHGIGIAPVWERQVTGAGAVIAILDTGITDHPDLAGQVVAGFDFVSDDTLSKDGDGRDSDPTDPGDYADLECGTWNSSWHGTQVAGIAAAAYNNGRGLAGAAPDARIMPVRVLGAGAQGRLSDIVDAIEWLAGTATFVGIPTLTASQRPDVINLSLGWKVPYDSTNPEPACADILQTAINRATQNGIVVVAAAGNSSTVPSRTAPAVCNNVITVAASDVNGRRAIYDNRGGKLNTSASNFGMDYIDVTAPGHSNVSTSNEGTNQKAAHTYEMFAGTSAAAPHVSAVVALMQSLSPQSAAAVLNTLKTTSRPPVANCSMCRIPGVIDADAAIRSLNVNRVPLASFTAVKSGACGGKYPHYYTLTNTSTDPDGDAMTALWTFSNGTAPATTWNAYFKLFSHPTSVTLKVTDEHGKSRSITRTIEPQECLY